MSDAPYDAALRAAGYAALAGLPLRPLTRRGVAHDHIAIEGSGLLLRIPRLSQSLQDPVAALAYQAASFRRAAPSGHTPRLTGVLPPGHGLPRGALLVEAIDGALPILPRDLAPIARALAAIHALPLAAERAPLVDQGRSAGPFRATLAGVEAHAAFLPRAGLQAESAALILAELGALRASARTLAHLEAVRLVGTDTHPGNFLLTPDRAIFVDLEKALYGAPAIDLAHATLPTSTLWDPAIAVELGQADTTAFYRAWMDASSPELVATSRPWFVPARRLTWLRTLFWIVRWRVLSAEETDWSPRCVVPALAQHMAATAAHLLDPAMLREMRDRALDLEI